MKRKHVSYAILCLLTKTTKRWIDISLDRSFLTHNQKFPFIRLSFFQKGFKSRMLQQSLHQNLSSFFLNHFDKKQKQSCTRLFTCTSRNMMCRCNSAHFCSHLSTKKNNNKTFFSEIHRFFFVVTFWREIHPLLYFYSCCMPICVCPDVTATLFILAISSPFMVQVNFMDEQYLFMILML